jgi:hypothetical protein
MIKLKVEKEERETKIQGDQGKGVNRVFVFTNQDPIEGVIGFRIDSRIMKRG